MTTEDIIIHIFYNVDNGVGRVAKDPCAKLYRSEVVTIGIVFALKGGPFTAGSSATLTACLAAWRVRTNVLAAIARISRPD